MHGRLRLQNALSMIDIMTPLLMADAGGAAPAVPAAGDVNSTAPRTDVPGEAWPEGDLPEQMGGLRSTLMPGVDTFIIPVNLAQLWTKDGVNIKVNRPGHPEHEKTITRLQLKFDKNAPLVVADGPRKDETMTATFTSNPRPRGKKDNPNTPWISDLAYMLDLGLADHSRPTTPEGLKAAINRFAGKTVRIEHGLTAQCRKDKVRYIAVGEGSVVDPAGTKGCDKRYYTSDFQQPDKSYGTEIVCDCGALLRGFPQVEKFLPPLGAAPAAAAGAGGGVGKV